MTYKYLTNLADILRDEGLKVVERDGWKTRGRPASTGGFNPVGVICHHTATPKSASDEAVIRLLVGGRSDLPGPLCQLGLGRDGTVYMIAAGRANHAGVAKSSGTVAAGDGNSLYIGIEAFNDGRGEPWPAAQYDAYVRLCAALCKRVTGNSVQTVRGHKETSVTGKIDPTFDMDKFRGRVADALKPAPKPKPKPVKRKGISIGTHNLHDDAGTPTLFADVLFFTEAIAPTIRARVKARAARTKAALAGYRVVRADENKTVVIAVKRRLFKVTGKEWHRAHGGKAGLTPARGTLLVRAVMRETGQPVSFLAEHRINDSWKPGARELPLRRDYWRKHTDLTKRLAAREIATGRTVFAGGDMNTTKDMSAWDGVLEESGKHLDRLGVSPDMHISKAEVLSRRGSDHPRVRATVTPKENS